MECLLMSKGMYYKKQKEAYGYVAYYVWKTYPAEQRKALWHIRREAEMQPGEVMYA